MKIFKKMSKKIMALLLSVSLLFSNVMSIATVFALTEDEKEDLVELRMRRATGIDIDNGEATIHYDGGEATVTGNDLYHVEDNHWDYGDGNYGVMHILYTSSTNLTFHFYSDEGMQVSINFSGNPPESPNNNEWTVNNLLLRNQRVEGYDLEFQFAPEINGSGGGVSMPNGSSYQVEFGNASWNLDDVNVTASIQGKDLTDGFLSVVDNEVIELTNFNPGTMEVRVSTRDGFSTELFVDEHNTTCLGWTINSVLPPEDLYFNILPRAVHNEGTYHVEFGPADWNIDGEYVVASVDGLVLNEGPVMIDAHEAIHLEGFNPDTMEVRVSTQDGFNTVLFVDDQNNTSIDAIPPEAHIPSEGIIYFNVVRRGGDGEPHNPPQSGDQVAIIRVNGVEGEYMETVIDPMTGEEREEPRPYDGRGSIANEMRFNVNDGNVWMLLPDGETDDDIGNYLYNEIEYNYEGEDDDSTIKLGLFTPWHLKFSNVITINNSNYQVANFINYNDKGSWLTHIKDDVVGFYITVPKAEDNVYAITVQIDPNSIEYLSEFRWTNDPGEKYGFDEHGEPTEELNPAYIDHVKLEIVNVHFSLASQNYNYNEANFSASEFNDDFISYRTGRHEEYTMGELFVPSDTTVTVRLTPDPGYQVTDILVPGGFEIEENPCEYTFTLPTFYDQFEVITEEVDNNLYSDNEAVEDVNITMPEAVSINGNYELIVGELDNSRKAAFNDQLNGYTPNVYFNLELNQILNKARAAEWVVPIANINKNATVELTLANQIEADQIIVICNRGNGNFETINPTVNGNTITFETRRFADYVIASMELQVINEMSITVAPPTPGETVNVTMHHAEDGDYPEADLRPAASIPNNAPYTIDGTAWVNGNCFGGANLCHEFFNGTFDQNGEYYAMIKVKANDGYKITYDILNHYTVNGRELDTDNGDQIIELNNSNFVFVMKIAPQGSEPPIMTGDMNGNGRIDLSDIIALLKKYLSGDATNADLAVGDMDHNGSIGLRDIILLLKEYLKG